MRSARLRTLLPMLRSALLAGAALVASTLAAVTGFGGAAVLLPVLVAVFGVRDAIPILTVAQLIGNGSRVWFNRTELDVGVVRWFALGGIPAALLGGLLFATTGRGLATTVWTLLVASWGRLGLLSLHLCRLLLGLHQTLLR